MTRKNQQYVDYIIKSLQDINPHKSSEGRIGYVYASGFLASFLADLMLNDSDTYHRFKQHIDNLKQKSPQRSKD